MECFRLLLEHLAWIKHQFFYWHKRFKEGRESVRDDERCGRFKEVRTPELIGQIKNFLDEDRHVSIETITTQFDVSVGTVHTIFREELKICAKFVPTVLREDQKERRFHDSREMVKLINSEPRVLDALVTCDESWIYCYDPETKRQEFPVEACWLSQTQEGEREQIHPQTFDDPFFFLTALAWSTCIGFPLDRQSMRNTMLRFQQEIRSKEASTLQIGSVTFPPGQCTSQQLHPCHRLFDQDGHQHSSSPSI